MSDIDIKHLAGSSESSGFPNGFPERGKAVIRKFDKLLENRVQPDRALKTAYHAAVSLKHELSLPNATGGSPDNIRIIYNRDLEI